LAARSGALSRATSAALARHRAPVAVFPSERRSSAPRSRRRGRLRRVDEPAPRGKASVTNAIPEPLDGELDASDHDSGMFLTGQGPRELDLADDVDLVNRTARRIRIERRSGDAV